MAAFSLKMGFALWCWGKIGKQIYRQSVRAARTCQPHFLTAEGRNCCWGKRPGMPIFHPLLEPVYWCQWGGKGHPGGRGWGECLQGFATSPSSSAVLLTMGWRRRCSCHGAWSRADRSPQCTAERHLAPVWHLKLSACQGGGSAGCDALGRDPSQRNKTSFREMCHRVISSQ